MTNLGEQAQAQGSIEHFQGSFDRVFAHEIAARRLLGTCLCGDLLNGERNMDRDKNKPDGLPPELVDALTKPFARFLRIEAAAGSLLLFLTLAAIGLANSPWSGPFLDFWATPLGVHWGQFDLTRSLIHWVNDGLMTLFFFVIALELKRALVLGELRHPRAAALPIAAAAGGMIFPVVIFLLAMDGQAGAGGWGTVMATDTAFVIGALALFGAAIPASLRVFLVSLAIFDDVGAIMVVAVGYGDDLDFISLGLAAGLLALILLLARIGIRSMAVYFLLGVAIWLCFDHSGIHATITGVILGLMTPAGAWVADQRLRHMLDRVIAHPKGENRSGDTSDRKELRLAGRAITESLSPLERLEISLHPWVSFAIMPIFALANAGVAFSGIKFNEPILLAVFAGLVVGKPLGVLLFSWLAIRLRFATMGASLDWGYLAAGAFLTGIGFTMSFFIASLAFTSALLPAAKIGILAGSAMSGILGISILLLRIHIKTR